MKTSTKILGILAAGIGAAFVIKSVREKTTLSGIDGLNIELNPVKLVNSGIDLMRIDPSFKEPAKKVAANLVGGFMQGKNQ